MTEPLTHKLDVSKIQTLEDVRNVFECMNLVASIGEDRPDYELIKKYFTLDYVPEPVKLNWGYDKEND